LLSFLLRADRTFITAFGHLSPPFLLPVGTRGQIEVRKGKAGGGLEES
jgi:hypothetical protein